MLNVVAPNDVRDDWNQNGCVPILRTLVRLNKFNFFPEGSNTVWQVHILVFVGFSLHRVRLGNFLIFSADFFIFSVLFLYFQRGISHVISHDFILIWLNRKASVMRSQKKKKKFQYLMLQKMILFNFNTIKLCQIFYFWILSSAQLLTNQKPIRSAKDNSWNFRGLSHACRIS